MTFICEATLKSGAPCSCKRKPGYTKCGRHITPTDVKHSCYACNKDGMINVGIVWMCHNHHTSLFSKTLRQTERALAAQLEEDWDNDVDVMEMFAKVDTAYDEHMITQTARSRLTTKIFRWLTVLRRMGLLDAPVPAGPPRTLGEIAANKQSVHTAAVSEQTNRAMEVLLSQSVPATLNVVKLFDFRKDKLLRDDVRKWYNTETCKAENDFLYRKTLDGVWVLIQAHKEKTELLNRLFEEMKESVGMCCEGHLSRLCNVLVGFDDRFSPPVPVGELLQQRISAIASQDVTVEQKVCLAWAVFEELKTPMEERDAWIEAF